MKIILKHKLRIGGVICGLALVVPLIARWGSKGEEPAATPASPPEVAVVEVEQKDVPIYGEWIGSLDGMVNAEIKAQVSGYLLRQNYIEDSFVRKGQLLFEIDPIPYSL